MSIDPNFKLSNPSITSPVVLTSPSGNAAETAYQVKDGEYFFELASGGSASNNFVGSVTIDDPNASLTVQGPVQAEALASPVGEPLVISGSNGIAMSAGASNVAITSLNGAVLVNAEAGVTINSATYLGTINIGSSGLSPINIGNPSSGKVTITGNSIGLESVLVNPVTVTYGIPGGETGFVYDSTANPILKNNPFTVGQWNQAFTTIYDAGYTPPVTGYYLVQTYLDYGTGAISYAGGGGAYVTSCLTLTNGSFAPIRGTAQFFPMNTPTTNGATTTYSNLVYLTGGVPIFGDFTNAGTVILGTGGGLTITAQQFGSFF